mgnify:CR=1 FL=1
MLMKSAELQQETNVSTSQSDPIQQTPVSLPHLSLRGDDQNSHDEVSVKLNDR